MYGKLESLGGRLLSLFVPKVEAEAACRSHSYCWQCGCGCYACCDAYACYYINCDC